MSSQQNEDQDKQDLKQRCFAGLSNQGATCYMNSLLQALYMTPEFRQMIYQWKYDSEKNAVKKDCIVYQLCKLFANLQFLQNKLEENQNQISSQDQQNKIQQQYIQKFAETNELTDSFQWDYKETCQQQDIQEFWMQLFDAIEITFQQNGIYGYIDELFKGVNLDFIKCTQCNYVSKREAKFYNQILAISDPFENIHHNSIEDALKGLLKVENLTGDNQYMCPQCDKKQDAQKGSKFSQIPKILMLQLNRFTLDMQTFNRKKLNDLVSFPLILNVNAFLESQNLGFSNQDKISELVKENPLNKIKKLMGIKKQITVKQSQKLNDIKINDNNNDIEMNEKEISFITQINQELGDTVMVDESTGKQLTKGQQLRLQKKLKEQEEHKQRMAKLNAKKKTGTIAQASRFNKTQLNNAFMNNAKSAKDEVNGWAVDFDNDQTNKTQFPNNNLFQEKHINQAILNSLKDEKNQQKETQNNEQQITQENSKQINPEDSKLNQMNSQVDQKLSIQQMEELIFNETNELKQKYFMDGPFVYELYGIMLHKGGAFGGHYSAYIKDLEINNLNQNDNDDKWYHFNDSFVQKISVTQLSDAFGGNVNFANAYMLMYRLIQKDNFSLTIPLDEIPNEVLQEVQIQIDVQKNQSFQRSEQKQKMQLKIIHVKQKESIDGLQSDQFDEQGIPKIIMVDRKNDTYQNLKEIVMKEFFGEQNNQDNEMFRLRAYNIQFQILMDTYDDKPDLTLEQLKIYPMRTLALEQKLSKSIQFQPYNPDFMQIKINLWSPQILKNNLSLQDYIEKDCQRISVEREMNFERFKIMIEQKFQLKDAIIMRRTPMMQDKEVQIFTNQEELQINLQKGLNQLLIIEGINLYVEEKNSLQPIDSNSSNFIQQQTNSFKTNWEREFDIEKNSYHIRFNKLNADQIDQKNLDNLNVQYLESIIIDRRLNVEDIKNQIAKQIGHSTDYLIFKRGGTHGAELVEDDLNFKQANIFNMMCLYIEKGQPKKAGYKRLIFYLAEYYNPNWDSLKSKESTLLNFRKPYDHEFFTFTEMFKQPIRTLDKVKQVKQNIIPRILEIFPNIKSQYPNFGIRLREKLTEKLSQVYCNYKILENYQMHDDKEIAIQIIEDENINGDKEDTEYQFFVMIKLWNPQEYTLGDPTEIWVNKKASLSDFAKILSDKFNISAENIMCSKIISPWNFHRVELPYLEWIQLQAPLNTVNECDDISVNFMSSSPFYLSTDGILFVIYDNNLSIREMTFDEKEKYRCDEFEQNMFLAQNQSKQASKQKGGEVGVKITVKSKEDENKQKIIEDQKQAGNQE